MSDNQVVDPLVCRNCGLVAPNATAEELFDQGWQPGERLCPSCRSARNARAAATTNRIVRGLAEMYAARFNGPDARSRIVTIQTLPDRITRSTWVAAPGSLETGEAEAVWRELGTGFYLWSVEQSGRPTLFAAVNVDEAGEVDLEQIAEVEIPAVQRLARQLGAPLLN